MYFMPIIFFSPTTTIFGFVFYFNQVIFFYTSLSPPSPTSKLTTSKLTSMLPKNLLFSLYCQADRFVTQGGKAEPRRA